MDDVFLTGFPVLFLQIKDVAHLQGIALVQIIVLAELLLTDVKLFRDGFPTIPCPYHDIYQAIGYVCLMRIRIFLHPFQATFPIVLMQVIKFDDTDELLGITGIGGIAGFLQSSCPTFIVGYIEFEKRCITRTVRQELGMVFVGLLGMLVGTETFSPCIVIMANGLSSPIATALDSEVIVRLAGECTLPSPRFQQALCQSDAGRDAVFLHFFHRQVPILLDVGFVLLVAGLCLKNQAYEYSQKGYKVSFHGFS